MIGHALVRGRTESGSGSTPAVPSPERREDVPCGAAAIRHVLVPLDGSTLSECALPFAAAVARALSARITLLRVLEFPSRGDPSVRAVDPLEWEMLRAEAHGGLSRLQAELESGGLTVAVELRDGRSAEQVIQFASEHAVDLIALSSHGEGGVTGWALSSTAQKVIARAHTSVLIVPAYSAGTRRVGELRFRRILVPLDCSPRAECVLPLAEALAGVEHAELILAHVVPEPEMPRRMPPSADDLALAARLTERNRVESTHYLTQLRDRLRLRGVKAAMRTVASMRRARALRDLADREDIDLVVLSAHGCTGDASERYGTVAARLIQESARPLIVYQDLGEAVHATTRAEEAARSHPGH